MKFRQVFKFRRTGQTAGIQRSTVEEGVPEVGSVPEPVLKNVQSVVRGEAEQGCEERVPQEGLDHVAPVPTAAHKSFIPTPTPASNGETPSTTDDCALLDMDKDEEVMVMGERKNGTKGEDSVTEPGPAPPMALHHVTSMETEAQGGEDEEEEEEEEEDDDDDDDEDEDEDEGDEDVKDEAAISAPVGTAAEPPPNIAAHGAEVTTGDTDAERSPDDDEDNKDEKEDGEDGEEEGEMVVEEDHASTTPTPTTDKDKDMDASLSVALGTDRSVPSPTLQAHTMPLTPPSLSTATPSRSLVTRASRPMCVNGMLTAETTSATITTTSLLAVGHNTTLADKDDDMTSASPSRTWAPTTESIAGALVPSPSSSTETMATQREAVQQALSLRVAALNTNVAVSLGSDMVGQGLKHDMEAAITQLRQDGVCVTRLERSLRAHERQLSQFATQTRRARDRADRAHKKYLKLCKRVKAIQGLVAAPDAKSMEGLRVSEGVSSVGLEPVDSTPSPVSPKAAPAHIKQAVQAPPMVQVRSAVSSLIRATIATAATTPSSHAAPPRVKPPGGPSSASPAGPPRKKAVLNAIEFKATAASPSGNASAPTAPAPTEDKPAVKDAVLPKSKKMRTAATAKDAAPPQPAIKPAGQAHQPAGSKAPAKPSLNVSSTKPKSAAAKVKPSATSAVKTAARVEPPPAATKRKVIRPAAKVVTKPEAKPAIKAPSNAAVKSSKPAVKPPPAPPRVLCPEAAATAFLTSRCHTSDLPSWAALLLTRLPRNPTKTSDSPPSPPPFPTSSCPYALCPLLAMNAFLPVLQQLAHSSISLLTQPPLSHPLPPSPLRATDLILLHPTNAESRYRHVVKMHVADGNADAIQAQHEFITTVADRLVLSGAMHTWGRGYYMFRDIQEGILYAVNFRDLTGVDGGVERVRACKDRQLRHLLCGRHVCLDPVHEIISLSRAVTVLPLKQGTKTLREAHRACFFKHVSKGRSRLHRLLSELVRLLCSLGAKDVACCSLSPDNLLLVPGDSADNFKLMVKSLEHGVAGASKASPTRTGSWAMQPPETILCLSDARADAHDAWSCGMLMLWVALGELHWTTDVLSALDPWRRGKAGPTAQIGEEAKALGDVFGEAVGGMLETLAQGKKGGHNTVIRAKALLVLTDLLSLEAERRVEALWRYAAGLFGHSKGGRPMARGPTAAGDVARPAKTALGNGKKAKGRGWRWGRAKKSEQDVVAECRAEIEKKLFEGAPQSAETFDQFKSKLRCVEKYVGEGGFGSVSGYAPKLPLLQGLFATKTPKLALKNMTSEWSVRGKAEKEVALHQAVASLPSGTHIPHYSIHAEHEAEYFMPFKRVMLDDLISRGFFYACRPEVRRARWLRLLYLLCDALVSYKGLDVAHRDLKPNNIAVNLQEDTFYITILDWGEGCFRASISPIVSRMGTPGYQPVEVMAAQSGFVGSSHDITSVGRIMVKAAIGATMYTHQARQVMRDWSKLLEAHYGGYVQRLEPHLRALRVDRLQSALETDANRFIAEVADTLAPPAALPLLKALLSPYPEVKEQLFRMDMDTIFGCLVH